MSPTALMKRVLSSNQQNQQTESRELRKQGGKSPEADPREKGHTVYLTWNLKLQA